VCVRVCVSVCVCERVCVSVCVCVRACFKMLIEHKPAPSPQLVSPLSSVGGVWVRGDIGGRRGEGGAGEGEARRGAGIELLYFPETACHSILYRTELHRLIPLVQRRQKKCFQAKPPASDVKRIHNAAAALSLSLWRLSGAAVLFYFILFYSF